MNDPSSSVALVVDRTYSDMPLSMLMSKGLRQLEQSWEARVAQLERSWDKRFADQQAFWTVRLEETEKRLIDRIKRLEHPPKPH